MITFQLNGTTETWNGNPELSLLKFLRNVKHLTAAKDGCSGQGVCGACLVEISGKPRLACTTSMAKVHEAEIFTLEGIPEKIKQIIATNFVNHGAVQCGFCSPGFVMRTHLLLRENPDPSHQEIQQALKGHLCRCTGYKKIESAISDTAQQLNGRKPVAKLNHTGSVGISSPKYQALETALGHRHFVNDLNGGGFGGKEDLTVQGHAALFAWTLKRPVKLQLSRDESIRMHPKRHPVWMEIALAADANGTFTAVRLKAIGDTGAYASVGTKVMERVVGHATGAYVIPAVDIEALTVYTNNIPSGAMRGFGVPQVTFAIESCIDDICRQGGFDRWQIRYNNALTDGHTTATGDPVKGVGIRACLEALKDKFYQHKFTGLACAIKNSGIGNGMIDFSDVIIDIFSPEKIILQHGWTEMGQGVHTVAAQVLCNETGIDPGIVEVIVDTTAGIKTGMTTSSRGTVLLGNAIIDACKDLKQDLMKHSLSELSGKQYRGRWECTWTKKPRKGDEIAPTHYSYGYAAQLVVLDNDGNIEKVYAAHDAGKIINPVLFEGQIEGAVHMGIGYAICEDLPLIEGQPVSFKMKDLNILRAHQTPPIEVIGVEVTDPVGPYGAKGLGEIGLIPTAAAVANAFTLFDGIKRYELPLKPVVKP
jgi:aldehyde oxidoreductase